jgi:hypothetical protein
MATGVEVLQLLCPNAGWAIYGNDYESINWFGQEPAITAEQFALGFAKVDQNKEELELKILSNKNAALAKLSALGLTIDDLKALGLG